MVKKRDASDVNGLEEVFRSQELSRATEAAPGGIAPREDRDEALVRRMLGHASSALRDLHRDDEPAAESIPRPEVGLSPAPDAGLMSERPTEAGSSAGGAAAGEKDAALSAEPPWKRGSSRYWTIAAFSGLAALVVAGVTADTGQHRPSNGSAQGVQGTLHAHGGTGASGDATGSASTATTAPGSLTGAVGSGALALGAPSTGARHSINDPGGHVTLGGAATTIGTQPASASGSSGAGGGSPGATGSGGTNPVLPVAAGVGSTVVNIGSSVTGLANQIGSAVPAATPATNAVTGAVSGVLNSVDQEVDTTTL